MIRNSTVISEIDFDRLSHLMESPRVRTSYASLLGGLKHELASGRVVPPSDVPRGVVTMNSKVRVRDLATEEAETYTLVYPDDADINEKRLSIFAPLGAALLGSRTGEVVSFDVPVGTRRMRIERILYQPEAAGHFHL
jgi:regulator of nucleoside diphosphate kinase